MVSQPKFTFTPLEDQKFQRIRQAFGISDRKFFAALGLQRGRKESAYNIVSSKDAAGKSTSFFMLSIDQRYILKSCTPTDVVTLLAILDNYRDHVVGVAESGKEELRQAMRSAGHQDVDAVLNSTESKEDMFLGCVSRFRSLGKETRSWSWWTGGKECTTCLLGRTRVGVVLCELRRWDNDRRTKNKKEILRSSTGFVPTDFVPA